jgi:protein TonB
VTGANPPAVFERSALRAVRRWRYNPRIEDGVAVAQPGIRVRIRFELEGS